MQDRKDRYYADLKGANGLSLNFYLFNIFIRNIIHYFQLKVYTLRQRCKTQILKILVFLYNTQAESAEYWGLRAVLKYSTGNIWPAGCMLRHACSKQGRINHNAD